MLFVWSFLLPGKLFMLSPQVLHLITWNPVPWTFWRRCLVFGSNLRSWVCDKSIPKHWLIGVSCRSPVTKSWKLGYFWPLSSDSISIQGSRTLEWHLLPILWFVVIPLAAKLRWWLVVQGPCSQQKLLFSKASEHDGDMYCVVKGGDKTQCQIELLMHFLTFVGLHRPRELQCLWVYWKRYAPTCQTWQAVLETLRRDGRPPRKTWTFDSVPGRPAALPLEDRAVVDVQQAAWATWCQHCRSAGINR